MTRQPLTRSGAERLRSELAHLKKNGGTILFVSHSPNVIIDLCDRAVLLHVSATAAPD